MFSLWQVIVIGVICLIVGEVFGFWCAAMCYAASHNHPSDKQTGEQ